MKDKITFKIDGITEEELDMILDNDNKKNNIYNNNIITSTSINTTTSSFNTNYITNKYYSSILYLLIKKKFTYYCEIKKLLGLTNNYHLPQLQSNGIVFTRESTKEEKDYLLKLFPNMPKKIINSMKVYELVKEYANFLIQPVNYDMIKRFAQSNIDDYIIIMQKNDYEIKVREDKEKALQKEREEKHMVKIRELQMRNGIWNY